MRKNWIFHFVYHNTPGDLKLFKKSFLSPVLFIYWVVISSFSVKFCSWCNSYFCKNGFHWTYSNCQSVTIESSIWKIYSVTSRFDSNKTFFLQFFISFTHLNNILLFFPLKDTYLHALIVASQNALFIQHTAQSIEFPVVSPAVTPLMTVCWKCDMWKQTFHGNTSAYLVSQVYFIE